MRLGRRRRRPPPEAAVAEPGSRRAQQWLRSGWLDVEFYGALRGRGFEDGAEAARDFVEQGMQERLSPHPALHFVDLPPPARKAWRNGRPGRLLEELRAHGIVAPQRRPATTAEEQARASLLALARRLAEERAGGLPEQPEQVDWAAVASRTRRPDAMSVILLADVAQPAIRAVSIVSEETDGLDVDVLVIDHGSTPHVALALHAGLYGRPGVEVLRVPAAVTTAAAANVGVARASGELVVVLHAPAVLRRGALAALRSALDDPSVAGAQPVLLGGDDTILSAGLVVPAAGQPPQPVLRGHQADDALRLEGHRLAAISPRVMALRVEDLAAVGGVAEDVADLCAALLQRRPGGFRVAPAARATVGPAAAARVVAPSPAPHPGLPPDPDLYERIGFVVAPPPPGTGGDGRRQIVVGRRRRAPEQRRWSVKLPSPPRRAGDRWGDTYFGDAVARALRELGEDVVTCRRGAHDAGPTGLDDVALAIRGLYPIAPTPGLVNVLWVISHPDDLDVSELEGYDLVFTASTPWSAELSERSGRSVLPLLQASEFVGPPATQGHRRRDELSVVFVGTALGERERPLVHTAVEAGVPLAVYGPGWEGLPDGIWRGPHVDNHQLPALYQRHGIVLADHWPDMARHGFIANRVFDAVASGARVVCDDVTGIHDVFDPRDVVVVHDAADISRAVADMQRVPRAEDIARPSLTFADRACTLMAAVSAL